MREATKPPPRGPILTVTPPPASPEEFRVWMAGLVSGIRPSDPRITRMTRERRPD
jgi:hypothetical protein